MAAFFLAVVVLPARTDERALGEDSHPGHLGHVVNQLPICLGFGQYGPTGFGVANAERKPLSPIAIVFEARASPVPKNGDGVLEGLLGAGGGGGGKGGGAGHGQDSERLASGLPLEPPRDTPSIQSKVIITSENSLSRFK